MTTAEARHDPRARDFHFLLGSWAVRHSRLAHRLVGADDWERFSGTAACRAVLDGLGNIDEIAMPSLGAVGMTLRLFDRSARRWSLHWSSSLTGVLEPPVIGGFDRGVGRFYGDDTHDGQPIRVRFVWDRITPTSARWQQAFSIDDERSWETNWIMEFSRAPDPSE
jgi:hypothetical protein